MQRCNFNNLINKFKEGKKERAYSELPVNYLFMHSGSVIRELELHVSSGAVFVVGSNPPLSLLYSQY